MKAFYLWIGGFFFAIMLEVTTQGRMGIITLNRPEKRNAFNADLVEAIHQAVNGFNGNAEIRAIVLTAKGKAFSAGADLAYLQALRSNSLEENTADSLKLAEMFKAIYNSPKLTFSLVDGYALAGGCGLATVTDFCYASNNAHFGYTEVKIGFVPAIVMTYLSHKITAQAMNRLLLTGSIISANEALTMGLISDVVDGEVYTEGIHRIQEILHTTSGQAITYTKQLMRTVRNLSFDEAIQQAAKVNAQARSSEDCIRGIDAFINKEKIDW